MVQRRRSLIARVAAVLVVAFVAMPLPAASAAQRESIRVRVGVLDFDPLMDGGTPLVVDRGWHDPFVLDQAYRSDVATASQGIVDQRIVRTSVIRGYPVKPSGFT